MMIVHRDFGQYGIANKRLEQQPRSSTFSSPNGVNDPRHGSPGLCDAAIALGGLIDSTSGRLSHLRIVDQVIEFRTTRARSAEGCG